MGRNRYQPNHAYIHPEDRPGTPENSEPISAREVQIFVVEGQAIMPDHPAHQWLVEFEKVFQARLLKRLRARRARMQEIIGQSFIDVTLIAAGTVGVAQLASIMIDRARMANEMRPRARVVPRPLERGQLVRQLA